MARGFWDWGVNPTGVATAPEVSSSETVARLGGLPSFDRLGEVVFADGFEDGLGKWRFLLVGTGASVVITADEARTGAYSALLTAGSDGQRIAQLKHRQPFPELSLFGLEFSLRVSSAIESMATQLFFDGGTQRIIAGVRWRDTEEDLQYFDAAGDWVTFATGIDLFFSEPLFHTWKLVLDPDGTTYRRFILNEIHYDLSDIPVDVLSLTTTPKLTVTATLVGRSGSNDTVAVDDLILTQNEP